MPKIITELDIPCIWGGILKGILLKNDAVATGKSEQITTKIIGTHGWLDNLNSMLPLAEKLINRHPNYEIYLYDRAGHGFSSHVPKGFDYSNAHNLQDLRTVVKTLGWDKEKFTIIGHSYGAVLGMAYAASYPEDVLCLVAIDALIREQIAAELFWKSIGSRIDKKLEDLSSAQKTYKDELTLEKAIEVTESTRDGISNEAAKLLTERSVRRDTDNKLHFTRDESLKILSVFPFTNDITQNAVISIKASVLFIGSTKVQWPKPYKTINLLQQHNPNFEVSWFDGPHHLHMTHVDTVADRIEQYFNKYLQQSLTSMITQLNIPCVWGGHLAGILLKNPSITVVTKTTTKIIGIHGWLDNLNSLLPLAEKLIDRHPNYEIYLYDRAGHGFSGHLPKGSDYSYGYNLRDLRTITQTLGWNKEKYSFIGHSYGGHLAMAYAAAYPEEISCLVSLDAIIQPERLSKSFWSTTATRIDNDLQYYSRTSKAHKVELTNEIAIELVSGTRPGINDESAKLLVERSVRRDEDGKLYFTRDEALKNLPLIPLTQSMAEEAIKLIQASVLYIKMANPRWPGSESSIQLLKEHNPNFEMTSIDGPHHFHMTHVDSVVEEIERYFDKYLK